MRIYPHPDNLLPGKRYTACFREDDGSFSVVVNFEFQNFRSNSKQSPQHRRLFAATDAGMIDLSNMCELEEIKSW